MSEEKAIVKFDPTSGFVFEDLDGMYRAAECFLQSGFAPRGFTTPQQIIICWARAAELGIRPLQAVEGMNVIGGRLGIGGDLGVAKVRSMGLLVSTPKKVYSGTVGQDDYTCTVTLHRKGEEPQEFSFSIKEAKTAGIYKNNWPLYPQRMTYYRALGFGLRDVFSDVLKGMYTSEELEDFQEEVHAYPWIADEAKIAANQAAEDKAKAAGAKFVRPAPGSKRPTPAEAAEPAFEEDKAKPAPVEPRTSSSSVPAFPEDVEARLAGAAKQAQQAQQPRFAEQLAKDYGTQSEIQAVEEPDDLDMSPVTQAPKEAVEPPAPTRPEWMDHVIRSVPHPRFMGKKISELEPKDLAKIEAQWIPKIEADMANASDDQKLELKLFQDALAHAKMSKPF